MAHWESLERSNSIIFTKHHKVEDKFNQERGSIAS